jgi:hypothetical protein
LHKDYLSFVTHLQDTMALNADRTCGTQTFLSASGRFAEPTNGPGTTGEYFPISFLKHKEFNLKNTHPKQTSAWPPFQPRTIPGSFGLAA